MGMLQNGLGHHHPSGRIGGRQSGAGNVPSPAPNANSAILAGNLGNQGNGKAQLAKLAMLANGGASIVHSTPIG